MVEVVLFIVLILVAIFFSPHLYSYYLRMKYSTALLKYLIEDMKYVDIVSDESSMHLYAIDSDGNSIRLNYKDRILLDLKFFKLKREEYSCTNFISSNTKYEKLSFTGSFIIPKLHPLYNIFKNLRILYDQSYHCNHINYRIDYNHYVNNINQYNKTTFETRREYRDTVIKLIFDRVPFITTVKHYSDDYLIWFKKQDIKYFVAMKLEK